MEKLKGFGKRGKKQRGKREKSGNGTDDFISGVLCNRRGIRDREMAGQIRVGVVAVLLLAAAIIQTAAVTQAAAVIRAESMDQEYAAVGVKGKEKGEEGREWADDIAEEVYWDSLELLAICVEAEAEDQGLEGKRLVTDVILNRADDKSGEWPDDITGVITQEYAFTSYWDGRMEKAVPTEETFQAVSMELNERSYPGIYYFREGAWPEYGTPWKKIGAHYFSKK